MLNLRSTPRPVAGEPDRPLEPGATAGGHGAVPGFVPAQFAPLLVRAAQRWNVSTALLAAQLYVESNFNPFAVSMAGAQGIAQLMPGTARAYGVANPFDAAQAIDAQAHLMRDLLRKFASVPLALAAYNAGPGGGRRLWVHPGQRRDAGLRRPHHRPRCPAPVTRSPVGPRAGSSCAW